MCFELYLRLAALFEVTKAVTAAQGRVCVNFAGCWQQSCCGGCAAACKILAVPESSSRCGRRTQMG